GAGTFKVLEKDQAKSVALRKTLVNYNEKTIEIKRTYTFKPDRITFYDQLTWLHPATQMKTFYLNPAFMPFAVQGPARLVGGATTASFYSTTSGGAKVPPGISYPFTAENF